MAELICRDFGVGSIFKGGGRKGTGYFGWIPWRNDWLGLYIIYIPFVIYGRRVGRVISIGEAGFWLQDTVKNTMAGAFP